MNDQPDEHIFLARVGGGHQQGQSHQRLVVEPDRIKKAAFLEIEKKKKGADTLVAIAEGVILYHKVEQVRRFFLDAGVEILSAEGLMDGAEDAGQILARSRPKRSVASPLVASSSLRQEIPRRTTTRSKSTDSPRRKVAGRGIRSSSY